MEPPTFSDGDTHQHMETFSIQMYLVLYTFWISDLCQMFDCTDSAPCKALSTATKNSHEAGERDV